MITINPEFLDEKDPIIKVVVKLGVPYTLLWSGETQVESNFGAVHISFEKVRRPDDKQRSGIILKQGELLKDTAGTVTYTNVICTLDFIDVEKDYEAEALSCLNRVLDYYRCLYKDENHISRLNATQLLHCHSKYVKQSGKEVKGFSLSFPGGLGFERPSNPIPNQLPIEIDNIPYWKLALADARHNVFVNNYRQVIINVNIALEGFLHEYMYKKMEDEMSKTDIDTFLNPSDGNYPTVFKILKRMYKDNQSNSQYEKNFENVVKEKITKYRNDIVHGNEHPTITKEYAESAINTLETLIQGKPLN